MSEIKITDLVDQKTIDKIKELDNEMNNLLDDYTNTAKELAKGLDINVKVIGDIDKLEKLLVEKSKDASEITDRLNSVMREQSQVIANTTNTISRQLMERERLNKTIREEYRDGEKVKKMVEDLSSDYEDHTRILAKYELQIKANKKAQKELSDQYEKGKISEDRYLESQGKLIAEGRELSLWKSQLQQLMKIEEKMNDANAGSYVQLSQQLELLKKTYKEMAETQRESDIGKEFERSIQELDAHLKDMAAYMGEFQRNVGNYAIAGRNGVATTESVMAAMSQQAVTTQDLVDQTKILTEAKARLNTQDERYGDVLAMLNAKISDNKARLTDVSDIIDVEAKSVAQAEDQNKRLTEALKNIDVTAEGAEEMIERLNAKITENSNFLKENSLSQESAKKDLKELVLEISNLTIQYNALSETEKESAEGRALASHIQELIEKAGVLKDAIADTNRAIANAASDTRTFDQLTEGAQLAADTFGLLQGASAALGIEEENLEQIQTKLLAAITLSNSVSKIQNSLQKESAIMQGVLSVQTKMRTVAENLHTASVGKGVVMTKALTVAQWGFNAAANANPIGLLVAGVTALIAAGYGLVKLYKLITGDGEEVKKNYEKQAKAVDDLCHAHDRLIEKLKARGASEAELYSQSIKNHQEEIVALERLTKEAERIYGKDSDAYKEAIDKKKDLENSYVSSREGAQAYIEGLVHETELKVREDSIGTFELKRELVKDELRQQRELLSTMLEVGDISYEQYKQISATLELRKKMRLEEIDEQEKNKNRNNAGKSIRDSVKELETAVRAGEDALLNLIKDSIERERKTEQLRYERQLKDLQEQLSKVGSKNIEMRTALNNQIEGLEAEHAQKMARLNDAMLERSINAQESILNSRLEAMEEWSAEELEFRLELLKVQQNREMLAIKQREEDLNLTTEQGMEMRANLVEKYARLETQIREEYAQRQTDLMMEKNSDRIDNINNEYLEEVNALKFWYNETLKAAGTNHMKREEAERIFNQKMNDLSQEFAVNTANAEIDMLEKILESTELSAEKRYEIEKELARKRLELEGIVVDGIIKKQKEASENSKKTVKDWWDNLRPQERARFILDIASDTVYSINGLLSAMFDRQIEEIEELQEINQAKGDEEVERVTELVNKKVITQEEGEARIRAAERKTAQENEKLEKQKAELQYKQAVYQKATDLAQAGISTALAITNALTTSPFPLGLAMAAIAGAMGAMQIATIVATPIPKYAQGTDYHKGGPAIVGDGGRPEVILFNGGGWLTPDTPTLVDLPRGASVIPSFDELAMTILPSVGNEPRLDLSMFPVYKPFDDADIKRKIEEIAYLTRKQIRVQHNDAYLLNYELFKSRI